MHMAGGGDAQGGRGDARASCASPLALGTPLLTPLSLHKGRRSYVNRRILHPSTPSTSKLEFSSLLWVIYLAFLNTDPYSYSKYGSGSSRSQWMLIRANPDPTLITTFTMKVEFQVKSLSGSLKRKFVPLCSF